MSSVPDIISELNDHGFEDTSTTRKVAIIQDAIWQLEGLKPWPFLETSINLNFDGTSDVATNAPTDFRAALRLKDLVTGRKLRPMRLEEAEDFIGINYAEAGDPVIYYFEGMNLKVWPVPPVSTGRLKLRYIKWSPAITDSSAESAILIPKYFHRGLITTGALQRAYIMEDDPELAVAYQLLQEKAIERAWETLMMRQYDMPDHVVVTDPDAWDYNLL